MTDKKKLIGIYLSQPLIIKLKQFILNLYTEKGITKSQSEIVEEAIKEYIDKKEAP